MWVWIRIGSKTRNKRFLESSVDRPTDGPAAGLRCPGWAGPPGRERRGRCGWAGLGPTRPAFVFFFLFFYSFSENYFSNNFWFRTPNWVDQILKILKIFPQFYLTIKGFFCINLLLVEFWLNQSMVLDLFSFWQLMQTSKCKNWKVCHDEMHML